jgi:hypothetical protein
LGIRSGYFDPPIAAIPSIAVGSLGRVPPPSAAWRCRSPQSKAPVRQPAPPWPPGWRLRGKGFGVCATAKVPPATKQGKDPGSGDRRELAGLATTQGAVCMNPCNSWAWGHIARAVSDLDISVLMQGTSGLAVLWRSFSLGISAHVCSQPSAGGGCWHRKWRASATVPIRLLKSPPERAHFGAAGRIAFPSSYNIDTVLNVLYN